MKKTFWDSKYLLVLILSLIALANAGCTMDASILNEKAVLSSTPLLSMNATHLDLERLSLSRSTLSTGTDGYPLVTIQWTENAPANEIKFKDIPVGADLICDSFTNNPAVAASDLETERVIYLSDSFWQPDDSGWLSIQEQEFQCYYELDGIISNPITFRVELEESQLIKITDPQQTYGSPASASISDAVISGNGQYLAFVTTADILSIGSEVAQVYRMNLVTREILLVSQTSAGLPGDKGSVRPSISADGNRLAFQSEATNLGELDTNGVSDIFLKDFVTGNLKLVSRAPDQSVGMSSSGDVDLSSDGEYLAYMSASSNIVPGDVNGAGDIFVYKVSDESTVIASKSSTQVAADDWSEYPSISGDGRYVAFHTRATNLHPDESAGFADDIYVRDLVNNTTVVASREQDGDIIDFSSYYASISDDGRYVAFYSFSSWVFPGDTNNTFDIFVRDLVSDTTEHISKSTAGVQANGSSSGPIISGDGKKVFYMSSASNLVAGDTNSQGDVFERDRDTNTTNLLSKSSLGVLGDSTSYPLSTSADGRYVVYFSSSTNLVSADTNNAGDIFILDQVNQSIEKIAPETSRLNSNGGVVGNFGISETGQFVVYATDATNMFPSDTNAGADIVIFNRESGSQELISKTSDGTLANATSTGPSMSDDSRYITYQSLATNLVTSDTNAKSDIFYHDRSTGETFLVSESLTSVPGNDESITADISGDGNFVVFASKATDLVAGDTNGKSDIFLWSKTSGAVEKISINGSNTNPNGDSTNPKISGNGRYIAYQSAATDLVAGDTNALVDIFVYDRVDTTTQRVSISTASVQANAASILSEISWDGQRILFVSDSSNLDSDTTGSRDLFMRNLQNNTTSIITKDSNGMQSASSFAIDRSVSISKDNRFVSFADSGNLDINEPAYIFSQTMVRDLELNTTTRVSRRADGQKFTLGSGSASMSLDGRYIVMISNSDDNTHSDYNTKADLFIRKVNLGN